MGGRHVENIFPFIILDTIPWTAVFILDELHHPISGGVIEPVGYRLIHSRVPAGVSKWDGHLGERTSRRYGRRWLIRMGKNRLNPTRMGVTLPCYLVPDHIE